MEDMEGIFINLGFWDWVSQVLWGFTVCWHSFLALTCSATSNYHSIYSTASRI